MVAPANKLYSVELLQAYTNKFLIKQVEVVPTNHYY